MTEEEKKLQEVEVPKVEYTANEYKSQYESQIKDLYDKISNKPAFDFNYNAADDALYNQYLDRYVQLGKQAMRDTMGQAAALTGGYGNSYGQGVAQQAYDRYIQGANDKLGEMADRAYSIQYQQYQDENDALEKQYGMLNDLEAMDYAKYMDRVAAQGDAWNKLASIIPASGYMPSEAELMAANMTTEEAKALQMQWAAMYPQLAYNQGVIDEEQHFQMTGKYPIGYTKPGSGWSGWDGGVWGPSGNGNGDGDGEPKTWRELAQTYLDQGYSVGEVMKGASAARQDGVQLGGKYSDIYEPLNEVMNRR